MLPPSSGLVCRFKNRLHYMRMFKGGGHETHEGVKKGTCPSFKGKKLTKNGSY
jgi:hypothetical protein